MMKEHDTKAAYQCVGCGSSNISNDPRGSVCRDCGSRGPFTEDFMDDVVRCLYLGCPERRCNNSVFCTYHEFVLGPPPIAKTLAGRPPSPNVDEKSQYDTKATNPKDAVGGKKLPMHLIPGSAKAAMALAFLEGALKYGKYNWRVAGVRASIYLDAMERHLEKFKNGENCDPETGVPHLGSVMACAAIIIDAFTFDKLNDDRPPSGPVAEYIDDLQANVRRLQDKFADCDPHQCTIEDTQYGLET